MHTLKISPFQADMTKFVIQFSSLTNSVVKCALYSHLMYHYMHT